MARYKPKRKQAERCQNCCARSNGYEEIYQGTFINFRNRQPLALGHQYRKLKIHFISSQRNDSFLPNNTNIKPLYHLHIHLSYVLDILLVIFSIL